MSLGWLRVVKDGRAQNTDQGIKPVALSIVAEGSHGVVERIPACLKPFSELITHESAPFLNDVVHWIDGVMHRPDTLLRRRWRRGVVCEGHDGASAHDARQETEPVRQRLAVRRLNPTVVERPRGE